MADNIGQVRIKTGNFGADVEARNGDIQSISTLQAITGDISAHGIIKKITTKNGTFTGVARAGREIGTIQALNLSGAVLSAGTDIKRINIKNDIIDSFILAGYDIGNECAFDVWDTLRHGDVGSISAKGTFVRSYICAAVLPVAAEIQTALPNMALPYTEQNLIGRIGQVRFGSIDPNPSVDYGLFAATEIKPVRFAGTTTTESIGYFRVESL